MIDGERALRSRRRQTALRFLRTFSKAKRMQLKIPHGAASHWQIDYILENLQGPNLRGRAVLYLLTIHFFF